MVYLLIAWWFSMAMLNNQMVCKKNMPIIFPVKSLTRLTWVFLRYVRLPMIFFSWPNLTALPQSSTWIYVKLLPRLKVPCGCPLLPFPALTLQGGGTPINVNLAGCFESAGEARWLASILDMSTKKGHRRCQQVLEQLWWKFCFVSSNKKTLTNPSIRTNPNTARLRSLPVKLPTSTIRSEGEFAFSRACKKQKSK